MMEKRRNLGVRRLSLLISSVGLVFLLFACRQGVDPNETASATVGVDASSVRLEGGARATFDAGFFSREAQVTLASSTAPQPAPTDADDAYARSVSADGPSVTLTLPYGAVDPGGTFAERKQFHIDVPKQAETESEMLEVLITLADGTEHFYLDNDLDAERPDEDLEGPHNDTYSDAYRVTLDNLQLRGGAAEGSVTVRVRAIRADQNARLSTQAAPSGFVLEDVVTGLNQGVVFDFASDGRIFIGEKGGVVRVFEDGKLMGAPFIDLSDQVNSRHDRGMLGLAVHPDFPAQPYVYLLFTYDPPELSDSDVGGPDGNGARVSRLIRVTADEAKGYNVAVPGSEKVLLGTNSTFANIGDPEQRNGPPSCEEGGVYVRDCLPADEQSHTIGTVRFAPDGSLMVGNGDGANYTKSEPYTTRALSLDSLAGKIMRIHPLTGEGYVDNPFYDGDPDSNRSKVYSLGLRNPFRFAVHPTMGEPFIGDVGRGTWEEVNTGEGANFGWPCYEGGGGENLQQGGFRSLSFCQDFYENEEATPPLYSYTRSGTSASVQVGDFYTGTRYPDEYQGALFITDYNQRWIRTLTFDADGSVADVNDFGTEHGVVQMVAEPGGDLYLMNIREGKLKRLRYTAAGNTPPRAQAEATNASGSVPLTVSFTGDSSADDDGDALSYAWDFGDGTTSSEANPAHTYEEVSLYRARLTVTDTAGASNTDTVLIEAGTAQPVAVILSPEDGATYTVGDQVPFLASDQGETLTDAEDFSWSLKLNHNEHQHFDQLPPTMGEDGAFAVPDHGDNTSLELCLEVMQNGNKSDPSCVTLTLNMVEYTLETEPSGLSLNWEGVERTTPFTVTTNVNARQQLSALAEQEGLDFVRWSDGGERIHDITIQDMPQTLTATYESSEPPTPVCGGLTQEAEDGELFGAFRTVDSTSASGGRYIDTPDGFGEQGSANDAHRADYCMNVAEAGRYKLTGWVQGASKSDSFYLAVDGDVENDRWDTPRNRSFEPQDAGRRNKPPFTFDLEAGEHTVSIYMREDGTRLDKLELVRVDTVGTSSDTCGALAQEAEDGELFGAFRVKRNSGASGGRYIDTPDGVGHQKSLNSANRADYCVNVDEPGRYKVRGWVHGARSSDSFYLGIDDDIRSDRWDTPRNSRFEPQDAARRKRAPFTFDLSAGEHTLSIYMREDGTRLDKLELVLVD